MRKQIKTIAFTIMVLAVVTVTVFSDVVQAATVKIASIGNISTTVVQGNRYNMPKIVTAIMTNKTKKAYKVKWNKSSINTAKTGKYIAYGTVYGYNKKVSLTVNVVPKAKPQPKPQIQPKEISFSDKYLEMEVRKTLRKPVGPITTEDAKNVYSLFFDNSGVRSLKGIEQFPNLELVHIFHADNLTDIDSLKKVKKLKSLRIISTPISDMKTISELTNLEYLFFRNTKIDNLKGLSKLQGLTGLKFGGQYSITDISEVGKLGNLTTLDMTDNPQLKDFSPILALSKLESLNLDYCDRINDLSVLLNMASLKEVSIVDVMLSNQAQIVLNKLEQNKVQVRYKY